MTPLDALEAAAKRASVAMEDHRSGPIPQDVYDESLRAWDDLNRLASPDVVLALIEVYRLVDGHACCDRDGDITDDMRAALAKVEALNAADERSSQ